MTTVISVENLSKSYRLGQIGTGTLTNDLNVWWAKLRGKPNPMLKIGQADHSNRDGETLWALRDVSFKVEQGEVLGVIGRNGAGKSTLLKILSRVTAPTGGCVKVKGRIASLLEVGTGFHPELTGRENIYLNGAILGMTKQEVTRKFDEIVAFAEVEKFIDTPVKRYSSGMYVRLAFAVAAHLESEILLVDEVLAVGDAEFQKKCLGKMGDVASKEGRTVLFVSHNMGSVLQLCQRVIWVNSGKIIQDGLSQETVKSYLAQDDDSENNPIDLTSHKNRKPNCTPIFTSAAVYNQDTYLTKDFHLGDKLRVDVKFHADPNLSGNAYLGFNIKDELRNIVFATNTNQYKLAFNNNGPKDGLISFSIENLPLSPGVYYISLFFGNGIYDVDVIEDAICIKIIWKKHNDLAFPPHPRWGHLVLPVKWETEYREP